MKVRVPIVRLDKEVYLIGLRRVEVEMSEDKIACVKDSDCTLKELIKQIE